ncbi:3093_t:CDS:2, partial [Paraglomus occultum]
HAVFPTIYRDMKEPKQYPKMVNITYAMTASIYLIMACCGYLMFGRETKEEIIQNIMATPGYNKFLNQIVVWMIAINPLAKYALTLNPINLTLEIYYSSIPAVGEWYNSGRGRRTALTIATRLLISTLVVCLAIQFPGFDKLFGWELSFRQKLLDYFIIVTCTCLASLGTLWAILT